MKISRREFLAGTTALAAVAVVPGLAVAQEATFKLGTWEGVKWIEHPRWAYDKPRRTIIVKPPLFTKAEMRIIRYIPVI